MDLYFKMLAQIYENNYININPERQCDYYIYPRETIFIFYKSQRILELIIVLGHRLIKTYYSENSIYQKTYLFTIHINMSYYFGFLGFLHLPIFIILDNDFFASLYLANSSFTSSSSFVLSLSRSQSIPGGLLSG